MGSRIAAAKGVTLDFSLPGRSAASCARRPSIPGPLIVIGIIVLLC